MQFCIIIHLCSVSIGIMVNKEIVQGCSSILKQNISQEDKLMEGQLLLLTPTIFISMVQLIRHSNCTDNGNNSAHQPQSLIENLIGTATTSCIVLFQLLSYKDVIWIINVQKQMTVFCCKYTETKDSLVNNRYYHGAHTLFLEHKQKFDLKVHVSMLWNDFLSIPLFTQTGNKTSFTFNFLMT